jgi:hypothetical protein
MDVVRRKFGPDAISAARLSKHEDEE